MLNLLGTQMCACGKAHTDSITQIAIGKGVLKKLPDFIKMLGGTKPFVLSDRNTFAAAGDEVCALLSRSDIPYAGYSFPYDHVVPDEKAVGEAILHFDSSCDIVVAVGSGVINDIGKIISYISGRKYIIVATAPSMDGYASDTSSMERDGLKVSLKYHYAEIIIGDTDILKNAPIHMLKSGLGDMLAKYVSIAEWRISHLITGEYYCEAVAEMVRSALKKCVDNADGLLRRDEKAVEAVFEGLVYGGIAMSYAGMSRPASGVEHYFSHIWDMRGLQFGTQTETHGIQCAWGTLLAAKLYDALRTKKPDAKKAIDFVNGFSYEDWKKELRAFLGSSAETMIAQEEREQKYNKQSHLKRLEMIIEKWDEILKILDEELPSYKNIAEILDTIGISKDLSAINADTQMVRKTFLATKDVRDKYVLSRLAWDLGILDELCELL